MRTVLCAAIACVLSSGASAAHFGDALAHYFLENYEAAHAEWQVLANEGDRESQFYLGLLYETGRGVDADIDTAVRWYKKAAEAGHRILFLTLEELMTRLKRAAQENRLERQLSQLVYPKVLIIDEIGYLPLDRREASLFFRLVARRYEKAATILTSNKGFVDWGEVFSDQVIATAVLDRLLHHATTLNIKGESFRVKEKRKAGLITQPVEQAKEDE